MGPAHEGSLAVHPGAPYTCPVIPEQLEPSPQKAPTDFPLHAWLDPGSPGEARTLRTEEDPASTGCLPTTPCGCDREPLEEAGQPLSGYIVGGLFLGVSYRHSDLGRGML